MSVDLGEVELTRPSAGVHGPVGPTRHTSGARARTRTSTRTEPDPLRITGREAPRRPLSGEPLQGQLQYLSPAALAVIDADEVAADEKREGQQAASLDVVVVLADDSE